METIFGNGTFLCELYWMFWDIDVMYNHAVEPNDEEVNRCTGCDEHRVMCGIVE